VGEFLSLCYESRLEQFFHLPGQGWVAKFRQEQNESRPHNQVQIGVVAKSADDAGKESQFLPCSC
jgi:hypothetical protein